MYFPLCQKKYKSENIQKNCVKKIPKTRSEESSRSVCSADQEDSLGKEKLFRRKIKKINIIVPTMKLCLFNSIGSFCLMYVYEK